MMKFFVLALVSLSCVMAHADQENAAGAEANQKMSVTVTVRKLSLTRGVGSPGGVNADWEATMREATEEGCARVLKACEKSTGQECENVEGGVSATRFSGPFAFLDVTCSVRVK